jgi:uncharacterized protein (TIGR02444 family)
MISMNFWPWLLDVYSRAGVSESLVALQDREHLNVNAAMFCCWLATQGVRLTREGAAEIEALNEAWAKEIVAPVRTVRRVLKTSPLIDDDKRKDIRGRIQAIELELEEQHCALLETRAYAPTAPREDEPEARSELAGDNLIAYLAAHHTSEVDAKRITQSPEWRTILQAAELD